MDVKNMSMEELQKLINSLNAVLKEQLDETIKNSSLEVATESKEAFDEAMTSKAGNVETLKNEFEEAEIIEAEISQSSEYQNQDSRNIFDKIVAIKHALINGVANIAEITKNTVMNTNDSFAGKMETMQCNSNIATRDALQETKDRYLSMAKAIEKSIGEKTLVKNQIKNDKIRAKIIKGQLKDYKNPRKRLAMQKELMANGLSKEKANEQIERKMASIERKSMSTLRNELKKEHLAMGYSESFFKEPFKPTTSFEAYAQSSAGKNSFICVNYNKIMDRVNGLSKEIEFHDRKIDKLHEKISERNDKINDRKDLGNIIKDAKDAVVKDAAERANNLKDKFKDGINNIKDEYKKANDQYDQTH